MCGNLGNIAVRVLPALGPRPTKTFVAKKQISALLADWELVLTGSVGDKDLEMWSARYGCVYKHLYGNMY